MWKFEIEVDNLSLVPRDPFVIRLKGCLKGSLNLEKAAKDIRWDPSYFEAVIEEENQEVRYDWQQQPPPLTALAILTLNSLDNAVAIGLNLNLTTAAGL